MTRGSVHNLCKKSRVVYEEIFAIISYHWNLITSNPTIIDGRLARAMSHRKLLNYLNQLKFHKQHKRTHRMFSFTYSCSNNLTYHLVLFHKFFFVFMWYFSPHHNSAEHTFGCWRQFPYCQQSCLRRLARHAPRRRRADLGTPSQVATDRPAVSLWTLAIFCRS